MNVTKKSLVLMVGGAIAATAMVSSLHAAENPFNAKSLASGYMVADAGDASKMKDGKCGTGKCGANKKKMKEASCGAEKAKEGSCSADKAKEASCSAQKAKEGSCHSDKK
jgi:uncharacterized low-complexity protein